MAVSRFEATQGDVVRLRVRMQKNEVEFDPFAMGNIEIRRRTSATTDVLVDTIPSASITREGIGVYFVDWPIPISEPIGAHIDRWFFTESLGDTEIHRDAEFVVFAQGSLTPAAGYITVQEVRDVYLPSSILPDSRIGILIETASEIVDKYTGRYFGGRSKTITEDGTGQAWIALDEKPIEVTAISVRSFETVRELDPLDFVIKGRFLVHKDYLPPGVRDWEGCVSICGCLFADIFERGQENVSVTGIFGDFASIPKPIERAVGLLVKYAGQDQLGAGPMAANYTSESVEQHSYALREVSSNIELRGATGIAEVDHILNLYRRREGRLSVI